MVSLQIWIWQVEDEEQAMSMASVSLPACNATGHGVVYHGKSAILATVLQDAQAHYKD